MESSSKPLSECYDAVRYCPNVHNFNYLRAISGPAGGCPIRIRAPRLPALPSTRRLQHALRLQHRRRVQGAVSPTPSIRSPIPRAPASTSRTTPARDESTGGNRPRYESTFLPPTHPPTLSRLAPASRFSTTSKFKVVAPKSPVVPPARCAIPIPCGGRWRVFTSRCPTRESRHPPRARG